ncbi:hypothetical protein [Sphaerisporangium sp. TRM90804]|uniref:hypothetical protein n=1 Tax=Sphaerisporangium sp. TRM90804 TaxID=3031113 RepID=UPI00244B6B0F|nr:hypothetical protein [Sphaerisporangium sp. TRM90804]MDH2425940.1 hypothetical protein [Sphaerisporangium sp. TRM90804]
MAHRSPDDQVLDASPQGLANLGALFDGQGDDVAGAVGEAMKRLASIGDFWGDDGAGHAFYHGSGGKVGYAGRAADLEAELRALATAYGRIGDNLVVMGRNIQAADWASIARWLEHGR